MQGEVREGGGDGQVPQVLQHLLRTVQVRPLRHLRQQAPVPLLPRHEELQGQPQVPLELHSSAIYASIPDRPCTIYPRISVLSTGHHRGLGIDGDGERERERDRIIDVASELH